MKSVLKEIRKSIVLVCMIILVNSVLFGATAGNQDENIDEAMIVDKDVHEIVEIDNLKLLSLNSNLFDQYYPMGGRSNIIIGTLIGPGNYTGSLSVQEYDLYTIPLNGSSINTDIINITVGTSSAVLGYASLTSPDLFILGGDFVSSTALTYINRVAITSAYHYIAVANPLSGTLNYFLNVTTTQTTNNQNDANNDFANATAAISGSSYQESLNYTFDYWDEFNITIPIEKNLKVTCEVVSGRMFEVVLKLYNAPNSSDEHLLAEVDDGWIGEDEILDYNSNITQIDGYLHVYLWNVQGISPYGNYWLNFSINEINFKPRINQSDPKLNTWNTVAGLIINEDEVSDGEINLSHHFMDDGKPSSPGVLEYSYESSDETNISVIVHPNSSVTITPVANWFGNAVVTFFANDSLIKISDDMNITVNSVNDKPSLDAPGEWEIYPLTVDNITIVDSENLQFTQGQYVSFDVTAEDIETSSLTFSTDLNITNTSLDSVPFWISSSTGNIEFTPTNDWVGTIGVNITVSDGTDIDFRYFTFWFDNVNDDPILNMVNTATISNNAATITGNDGAIEDEQFNFTVSAMDIDLDIGLIQTLTFAAASNDVTINDEGAYGDMKYNYSFTPDNDNALMGYVLVNVTVKDDTGSGVDDWAMVNVTVANMNNAPTIELVNDKKPIEHMSDQGQIKADETMNITITGKDIDGQTLVCMVTGNATVTALTEVNKWKVTFTPTEGDEGSTIIKVTVSDGKETDYVELKWLVLASPKAPPTIAITSEDNTKVNINDEITIEGTYSDTNDDVDEIWAMQQFPDGTKTDFYKVGYSKESYDELTEAHRTGQLIPGIYVWEYLTINTDGTWQYMFDTGTYNSAYDWYMKNQPGMMDTFGLVTKVTDGNMIFSFKAIDTSDLESDVQSITMILEDDGDTMDLTLGPIKKDTTLIEGAKVTITIDGVEYNGMTDALGKVQITLPKIPADGTYKVKVTHEDYQDLEYDLEFSNGVYNPLPPKDMKSISEPPDKPDEDDDGDEDKGLLGMGAAADYAIIIVIIIIIIIVILLVVMKKKKPVEEEALPPSEAMVPPAEVACTQCGAMIPPGTETCSACGAPAPPPVEVPHAEERAGAPPMEMACPACGATIPAGYPTCPGCGASPPPPLPSEVPPQAPPEEMPPEQPPGYEAPPEGIPPEQQQYAETPSPPPEYIPPQPPPGYGAPPPEMPPEQQQYTEAPPPEYIPPEQPPSYGAPPPEMPPEQQQYTEVPSPPPEYMPPPPPPGYGPPPPAGMATCPTCGAQIIVGTSPCPGCGTFLNW